MSWWQWLPVVFIAVGAAEIAYDKDRENGIGRAILVAALFLGTVVGVNYAAHEAGFELGAACALDKLPWDDCH